MNCLLIYKAEVSEPRADGVRSAEISGQRAQTLIERHDLQAGITIQGALHGVGLGAVTVCDMAPERLVLELGPLSEPPARLPMEVVVGVSRPPTMKKVIHCACALGIESLVLVRTDGSDKSYLMSKLFEPEALDREVELALEQARDCREPNITIVHYPLAALGQDEQTWNPSRDPRAELVADTYASPCQTFLGPSPSVPRRLYIGPERGWSQRERDFFRARGALPVSLGPRMLRVETAFVLLVGKFVG